MVDPKYPGGGHAIAGAADTLLPAGVDPARARLLFVHAHPDDEAINTAASMGHYSGLGATTVLLTMTRGERGEVIPPALRHLEVGQPGCPDTDGTALGLYRISELDAAAAAMGLTDRFYAGEPPALDASVGFANGAGKYVDSGMSWGPDGHAQPAADVSPAALTAADPEEAAAHVAAAVRALQPHAVVTYSDDGGYGHPDHVATFRVTVRAVQLAAAAGDAENDAWSVPLTWGIESEVDPADRRLQAAIRGDLAVKRAAMAAHATQIVLAPDPQDTGYTMSNGVLQHINTTETYRLLDRRTP
ncbi:1D-myo-inositol 2-acetamido-2-deoxy-alpha-D-glucopyranoside deacetylase [Kocuria tytonicola]|uniref:1D-myo-inositol 2-acetamido-2-deoxy-alpha-D-glucopyranoside deacetylase n=1 Tax=Kocuria tytonicola TaxID=2055946 RepID=A0A3L9L6C1_9MICC|nr:PIG-L family deacetylase [Kocuria tytonicola]RLY94553.1 1D-myo-inositol 2-acetamido-2-deoxy-alpha-D-glucopyranoside deacetylase [Kocuria tytonicola]